MTLDRRVGGQSHRRPKSEVRALWITSRTRLALRAGISDDHLRRDYQQVIHGWWLPTHIEVAGQMLRRTALWACPTGSFLSHHSAAAHLGAVIPTVGEVHVGRTTTARVSMEGIHRHRFKRSPDVRWIDGLRCTTEPETSVDLGWSLSLVDLVV